MDIYNLKTSSILLIELCLFDGLSNSTISEVIAMLVVFPFGKYMNLNFYITLLDYSCSLVLGYN